METNPPPPPPPTSEILYPACRTKRGLCGLTAASGEVFNSSAKNIDVVRVSVVNENLLRREILRPAMINFEILEGSTDKHSGRWGPFL